MAGIARLAVLMMTLWFPGSEAAAAEADSAPVEMIVTGRQPGPPLWKVSNGDKVLWIFPHLNRIPHDLLWDSERVARVIVESQEFISLPESSAGPPLAAMLNPINILRAARLRTRLERNPDGGTLEENLAPELYMRFAALKSRYFPASDEALDMRPQAASRSMAEIIPNREGLVSGNELLGVIESLVRRNGDIRRTEISVHGTIGDGYGEWAQRFKALYESFPPEQERACLEQVVAHMEKGLNETKQRADRWERGAVERSPEVVLVFDTWDRSAICADLYMGSSSSEQETLLNMISRRDQMWLDAAEQALARNSSTFAILPINELLSEDGLLSRLKAAGYEVREP